MNDLNFGDNGAVEAILRDVKINARLLEDVSHAGAQGLSGV